MRIRAWSARITTRNAADLPPYHACMGGAINTDSKRDIHGSAANASYGSRRQNDVGIQAEKDDTTQSGNERNNTDYAKPRICHKESLGNPARDRG